MKEVGCYEFFPGSLIYLLLGETICNGPLVVFCESVLLTVFGDHPGCLNQVNMFIYIYSLLIKDELTWLICKLSSN